MARWKNALQTKDEVFRLKGQTVLRECGRIFSQQGFHNTSVADVARHLDVSKGTLYNYVKDKQEILFEFHRTALTIGHEALESAAAHEGSGAERLRAGMRTYIVNVIGQLGGYGAITELGALNPEDRQEIIEGRERFDREFVALVETGIADGTVRQVDAKMAVFTFMGALQTIPNWFSPSGRLTGEEVADRMSDLLMCGMAAAPCARATTRKRVRTSSAVKAES